MKKTTRKRSEKAKAKACLAAAAPELLEELKFALETLVDHYGMKRSNHMVKRLEGVIARAEGKPDPFREQEDRYESTGREVALIDKKGRTVKVKIPFGFDGPED